MELYNLKDGLDFIQLSYVRYLCLFTYIGVQHTYVYPMLQISMDCPFLVVPSVFSNVYLLVELVTEQYQLNVDFDWSIRILSRSDL